MPPLVRRMVSLSILFGASVVVTLLFPLLLILMLVLDIPAGKRLPRTRTFLLLCFYCLWEVAGVTALFLIWLAHVLLPGRNAERFLTWNYAVQRIWTAGFRKVGMFLFSIRLNLREDYAFPGRPFILLARHTSLADTILVSWLVLVHHRIRMRYIMKKELLWDPCLDIAGNRLPNYFVDRYARNMQQETAAVAGLAQRLKAGEGIVLFPEGTRFSEAKRERALKRLRARENDEITAIAESFRHVLPPKIAGVSALLDMLPEADVVFLSHTGFENAVSFQDFFRGAMVGREIRAELRGVTAGNIPRDDDARKIWLFREWKKVEDFVRAGLQNSE